MTLDLHKAGCQVLPKGLTTVTSKAINNRKAAHGAPCDRHMMCAHLSIRLEAKEGIY